MMLRFRLLLKGLHSFPLDSERYMNPSKVFVLMQENRRGNKRLFEQHPSSARMGHQVIRRCRSTEMQSRGRDHGFSTIVARSAYLRRKQQQRNADLLVKDIAKTQADRFINSLKSAFSDSIARSIPKNVASLDTSISVKKTWIANVAVLVEPHAEQSLKAIVEAQFQRCQETAKEVLDCFTLEVVGPWPVYSFCPTLGAVSKRAA